MDSIVCGIVYQLHSLNSTYLARRTTVAMGKKNYHSLSDFVSLTFPIRYTNRKEFK